MGYDETKLNGNLIIDRVDLTFHDTTYGQVHYLYGGNSYDCINFSLRASGKYTPRPESLICMQTDTHRAIITTIITITIVNAIIPIMHIQRTT